MNVSLTPQLEKFVERKVKQGGFQTSSEVVRAALRLLADYDERQRLELAKLRDQVRMGLAQVEAGEVSVLDVRKIKREGRRRQSASKLRNAC